MSHATAAAGARANATSSVLDLPARSDLMSTIATVIAMTPATTAARMNMGSSSTRYATSRSTMMPSDKPTRYRLLYPKKRIAI